VQDEIAQAITAALTHTLGGAASVALKPSRPAIDPNVYRDYLQAQAFSALKTDEGDAHAVELFKSVTAREPNFAPAFAALGRTYVHMANFHSARPSLLASAKAALQQALRLEPRNLEALSTDLTLATSEWDWSTAATDLAELQATNAHNVYTLRGLQFYYGALGFSEQQAAALQEVVRLDPLSFVDLNNLASVYVDNGQYPEAIAAASGALALKPNRPLALYSLCWADAAMNHVGEARALSRTLVSLREPDAANACLFRVALAAGNFGEAHRLANAVAEAFPAFVFGEADVGYFYALVKDYSAAQSWLMRAYTHRDSDLFSLAYSRTTPPDFVKTSGWKTLMSLPEARAWQKAHDRVAMTLGRN
jgi:tetratricopeptide (TPR) repeat protein